MSVVKVIELIGESEKSWEHATKEAVEQASKSIKGIKSVWVKDQSCEVKDGKIDKFRVTCKISFKVKD